MMPIYSSTRVPRRNSPSTQRSRESGDNESGHWRFTLKIAAIAVIVVASHSVLYSGVHAVSMQSPKAV